MTPQELEDKYPKHFSGPRGVEVGPGWFPTIEAFIQELDALPGGKDVVFFSIKEKFGILRIDEQSIPEELGWPAWDALTKKYQTISKGKCEVCGLPGQLRGGGYFQTLCDFHNNKDFHGKS